MVRWLSDLELRTAIATEILGWTNVRFDKFSGRLCGSPAGVFTFAPTDVPDYPNEVGDIDFLEDRLAHGGIVLAPAKDSSPRERAEVAPSAFLSNVCAEI